MLYIRSIIFIIFTLIWTLLCGLLGSITFLSFSNSIITLVPFYWGKGIILAQRLICGVKVVVIGSENLPSRPFIVASKHQSVWETIFYLEFFCGAVFILKKELNYIPLYGWYLPLIGMISIDRGRKHKAIIQINEGVENAIMKKKIVIIFPEGTRVKPLQSVAYKSGIASIHQKLPEVPIVPIALNSGCIWPKGSWLIRPGIIYVKILQPLKGTHNKNELLNQLQTSINKESDKLVSRLT